MPSNSILNIKKDGEWVEIPALKGEDGFSPTATVEKVGKVATITITDINGTTSATIADGTSSSGSGEENTIESISVNGAPISVDENKNVDITVPSIDGLTKDADLATVAKSGSYEDLSNKPTIPDITGLATETYVDNKVADYTKTADLADVATSGSYNDLVDKPTIPSVDGLVSEDTLNTTLGTKVDKVNGKGLSTNDLTDDLKASYDDAVDKVHTHPDPLAEKTVVFLGDSITVGLRWQTEIGDTTNKYGWAKIIQEHFPTATVKNLAISGACIANTGNYIDVIMQYDSMSNTENAEYYTPNPDYIIFSGGGNDGLQTIPMGTICDGFAPSINNTNTTIGALEYMFAHSYNKYPTARKGFIITQRITDAVEKYYDAIRNVCQKWSIPVLDLSRVGEINAFIDGIATTYFTTDDRVHPNEKCYREILAPKVEKWLMSQMI